MDKQQLEYFELLEQYRSEKANSLETPDLYGMLETVIEKYTDQAHFVYELIQNADDAGATEARFILEPTRLIFAHNGTRCFNISSPNPEDEDRDSLSGALGDVNAITSVGNSNKDRGNMGEVKIGKFGVGFKAVFRYTASPHIFDPGMKFKIERFIVPSFLSDEARLDRKPNETLFIFPFNRIARDKSQLLSTYLQKVKLVSSLFVFPFTGNDYSDDPRYADLISELKKIAARTYDDVKQKLRNLRYPHLFLSNLRRIEYRIGNETSGAYEKEELDKLSFGNITVERVQLKKPFGQQSYNEYIWLFSRKNSENQKYSIGFFTDSRGTLRPESPPAFCFFPTTEHTGLNFIVHAPFLLTDSREGIRAGEDHNVHMIDLLSDLAASSILLLSEIEKSKGTRIIDDNIVDIIPYDPNKFGDPSDRNKISFKPFYDKIQNVFLRHEIIPSTDGLVKRENAYWALNPQIATLFSNEQLQSIVENPNARWAFPSKGRDFIQVGNRALFNYIELIVRTNIGEDAILMGRSKDYYDKKTGARIPSEKVKGIDERFIQSQSFEWLREFYKWLGATTRRISIAKTKPFFLDQTRRAKAPFDKDGRALLFLPVEDVSGYSFVHSELLSDPETRKFISESIGIKPPANKDLIFAKYISILQTGNVLTDSQFAKVYEYFCKSPREEGNKVIEEFKNFSFVKYREAGSTDSQTFYGVANSLFFADDLSKSLFETKPDARFLALDEYYQLLEKENLSNAQLTDFFVRLGARSVASIVLQTASYQNVEALPPLAKKKLPAEASNSKNACVCTEPTLTGVPEIIDFILLQKSKDKSVFLWKFLLKVIDKARVDHSYIDFKTLLWAKCEYKYRKDREFFYESYLSHILRTKEWIFDKDGRQVAADKITLDSLSEEYFTDSKAAQDLLCFLGLSADAPNEYDDNLTPEQKIRIKIASIVEKYGFDPNNPEKLEEFLAQHISDLNPEEDPKKPTRPSKPPKEVKKVVDDIVKILTSPPPEPPIVAEEEEEDDYRPRRFDYKKAVERAKEKSAGEIAQISQLNELRLKAESLDKYSFGWFKSLLEMESLNYGESRTDGREITITFAKVEREPGTERTLILKHPSRYIPQYIEELADLSLVLQIDGSTTKTVKIEAANVISYTLRVKLKSADEIKGVDVTTLLSATLDVQSPAFLLDELRQRFIALDYDDDFNMRDNFVENVKFIFGPPGTGKTTYLAKEVLVPLMRNAIKCKILVLTPTNKAADVLVKRIMEVSGSARSYENWLVRFGTTGDERLEQSPVFVNRNYDIESRDKNVTVTTIARFPYDFFEAGRNLFLRDVDWDYIVFDEASMIPLANIVYPIYYRSKPAPKQIVIAGDPFQIEPIASVDQWKDENIYKLVELDKPSSFENPRTVPHQYAVTRLTTQYRSVPAIGDVFSKFAYNGVLRHHRSSSSQRPLKLGTEETLRTFNIVKFPTSKYESIYRPKRLQQSSSYQIYSALFTFEFARFLSDKIARFNPNERFTIGIVAPYKAQANLIDKLFASVTLPEEVDVQVGTIHGFQGDECDIMIAVFNPPPHISSSSEMFLNKRNIINVSISRARDYLFIVMPDNLTENIQNLRAIAKVERLIYETGEVGVAASSDLEQAMFGEPNYLENNAFSTGHQSVNVYGLPEKRYEIRSEENAVDIQIHKPASEMRTRGSRVDSESVQSGEGNRPSSPTEENNARVLSDDIVALVTEVLDQLQTLRKQKIPTGKFDRWLKSFNLGQLPSKLRDSLSILRNSPARVRGNSSEVERAIALCEQLLRK